MNTTTLRSPFQAIIIAALCAAVVIGFARTYYLRVLFDLPPLTRAAHLHGILSTLWLALHFAQARLVAARRIDWHRTLGVITAFVGVITFFQAGDLAITSAQMGHGPPGRMPQQFLSFSLGTTFMFGLFLFSALAMRKRREWHKRLMLLATMVLLVPAIGRLGGLLHVHFGTARTALPLLVTIGFVVWAWWHDRRTRGNVHPAMLYGGLLIVAAIPFRAWLGTTELWQPFGAWVLAVY